MSVPRESDLVAQATAMFMKRFGTAPTLASAAPGRCNLIGEHTDYNDGFVFPIALEHMCVIVAAPVEGDLHVSTVITCKSQESKDDIEECSFPSNPEKITRITPSWGNYICGVVAQFKGHVVPAFNAAVVTTVPIGGGLSSSASLEVATVVLVEQLIPSMSLSNNERALWCQRAEHDFANVPCGIMDQFISVMGVKDHALLIDCRSLDATNFPLTDPEVTIFIANSNVVHELTGSEYPERRAACERAVEIIRTCKDTKAGDSIHKLRDVTMEILQQCKEGMDHITYRRAKHVVMENDRTTRASQALLAGDYNLVGQLMYESHESLSKDFEVSTKELDELVTIARGVPGVYGSRMTGGGFGGCTVTLVTKGAEAALRQAIATQYSGAATVFTSRPAPGAHVMSL